MFAGKFEDIISLGINEQKSCIDNIKKVLQTGKDHQFTNFEMVLLKTLESQHTEIEKLRNTMIQAARGSAGIVDLAQENVEIRTQLAELHNEGTLKNVQKLLRYLKAICESHLDQEGVCTDSCPCKSECDYDVWQAAEAEMKAYGIDIELS